MTDEYQIRAYPTLKWFSRGRHHEMRAPRTATAMLNWINTRLRSENVKRSTDIDKCKDLEKMVTDDKPYNGKDRKFSLIYFGETYENMYKNIHMQMPDHAGQMNLWHITDEDCAKKYKSKYPGFLVYRNFETPWNPYKGLTSLDDYNKFIRYLMMPNMFEFTEDMVEDIFEQDRNAFVLFHDSEKGKPDYWFTYKEAAY